MAAPQSVIVECTEGIRRDQNVIAGLSPKVNMFVAIYWTNVQHRMGVIKVLV